MSTDSLPMIPSQNKSFPQLVSSSSSTAASITDPKMMTPTVEYYTTLMKSMDDLINLNNQMLDDREAIEKRRKLEEKVNRQEAKDRVRSLLARYEQDHIQARLPLWKHKLRGNSTPKSELLIGGKSLFRTIVKSMMIVLIRPYLHVMNRKRATRTQERDLLEKTLMLYGNTCDSWISQLVKISVQSIDCEESVDFEFRPKTRFTSLFSNKNILKVLQLKVRVKSLIESITTSIVPTEIIENLLHVLIEDGNYFRKSFLFDAEKERLEFDTLGATKNMTSEIDEHHDYGNEPPCIKRIGSKYIDIRRAKLLIQNFLLIRILLGHILLSPWFFGVCPRPRNHTRKIMHTYRVFASVIYIIISRIDSSLDKVEVNLPLSPFQRRLSRINFDIENQMTGGLKSKKIHPSVKPFNNDNKASSKNKTEEDQNNPGDVDTILLNPRPTFEKLSRIHMCLVPESYFAPVLDLMEPWLAECQQSLDDWLTNLTVSVIESKDKHDATHDALKGSNSNAIFQKVVTM